MIKGVTSETHPIQSGVAARRREDRQAAVFEITQSLRVMDMREWTWTIFDWLRLYDGFEEYLPVVDDPLVRLAHVFAFFERKRGAAKVTASMLAKAIEQERFMRWRAQWVDAAGHPVGEQWQPLQMPGTPWWEYMANKPVNAANIRTQMDPATEVEATLLRQWLVAGYLRFVLPRRAPDPD